MGKHKGFTFIEIALFLAVTAALFIGVALGVNNSIFQQQYNDATQNFFEFMRSIYSQVSNPQSVGKGNSETAIYGKLVVFGETMDLLGNSIPEDEQQVFVYDVVGDVSSVSYGDIKKSLSNLNANVVKIDSVETGASKRITAINLASPEKYIPKWNVGIETTERQKMEKSILVVRHPRSATISTLILNGVINVNEKVKEAQQSCIGSPSCNIISDLLKSEINNFTNDEELDICLNPYGLNNNGAIPRRDIRILENARNASSVELIPQDDLENRCINY